MISLEAAGCSILFQSNARTDPVNAGGAEGPKSEMRVASLPLLLSSLAAHMYLGSIAKM